MRANPWIFGIIFIVIGFVFFYNNFEFPKLLLFKKTNTADAVIIQTKEVVGRIPFTSDFINTYVFEINDSIYISRLRTPSFKKEQHIGDSIKIEYELV